MSNPRENSSEEFLDALRLLDYIFEETPKVIDAIKGIALITDSEYSGVRRAAEAALEVISDVAQECYSKTIPESKPTFYQRVAQLGHLVVSKHTRS